MSDAARMDWLEDLIKRSEDEEAGISYWVGIDGRMRLQRHDVRYLYEGKNLRECIDQAIADKGAA